MQISTRMESSPDTSCPDNDLDPDISDHVNIFLRDLYSFLPLDRMDLTNTEEATKALHKIHGLIAEVNQKRHLARSLRQLCECRNASPEVSVSAFAAPVLH